MIENIYEELKGLGAASSRTDFSERWLGMEGSYFRGERVKTRDPSPKALVTCAARLQRHADALKDSAYPQVRRAANRYAELAETCISELLAVYGA